VFAEEFTCRAFVTQSWRLSLDQFPGWAGPSQPSYGRFGGYGGPGAWFPTPWDWRGFWDVVRFPKAPLRTIDLIQYVDTSGATQTIDPALYQADTDAEPGRLRPAFGKVWPTPRWEQLASVKVTYTCGYGAASAVPDGIKTAIKMHVAHRYINREGADIPDGIYRQLDPYWVGSVQLSPGGRRMKAKQRGAGDRNKQVDIEALPANQAKDPNWNEPTYGDWAKVGSAWASIEPLSGRELVFADAVAADATHMVTVQYFQGLTERMRFKYVDDKTGSTRYFNIVFVKDVGEGHWDQQCYCQEARKA
jgi:SPP1 family predicted phage head-tail adaptor